jgi:hypothetical protein
MATYALKVFFVFSYMLEHQRLLFLSEYINADPGYVSLAKSN